MINLAKELASDFKEIEPMTFYRAVFRKGILAKDANHLDGKFRGIGREIIKYTDKDGNENEKSSAPYFVYDNLDAIERMLESENFCILSPIAYIGRNNTRANACIYFAFAIEIDEILKDEEGRATGYENLINQMHSVWLPMPNYIVASGNGLHLYYLFEEPMRLHDSTKRHLANLKDKFQERLWTDKRITTSTHVQDESAFQGFRLAGGVAKNGERTKVFETDNQEYYTLEALEKYFDITRMTKEEAMREYPNWNPNREEEEKKIQEDYISPRGMYDDWLKRITKEAVYHHRYWCLWSLVVYAIKCDIPYEELEADCKRLQPIYDALDVSNRFTEKDMNDALKFYTDKESERARIRRTSKKRIIKRTGIDIGSNKRNHRKRNEHLQADYWINKKTGRPMRNSCKDNREMVLLDMRLNGEIHGRPKGSGSKRNEVIEWREKHPTGKKIECQRDTGMCRATIAKWWNEKEPDQKASEGEGDRREPETKPE